MCGIAGIVSLVQPLQDFSVQLKTVQSMVAAELHRGPDGVGLWHNQNCIFGHCRLSILDLTPAGHQPMVSDYYSNVVITFNGEIYNYRELKDQLVTLGYQFKSETDTEVLLKAYEEWGIDCVKKLFGMFAFAIWDNKLKRLVLGRDRVGTKPLFYNYDSSVVSFASEIRSLLKIPQISRELDWQALDTYLSYGYVPSPHSGFVAIKKLPPAHIAIFESAKPVNIFSYWSLSYLPKQQVTEQEAIRALQHSISSAVHRRMTCDVPFGAFLSGGIDSSIVVGLMAQQSHQQINTFSIGFDDFKYNELDYARLVASKWSTNHSEFIFNSDMVQNFPQIVSHFGEPFADISSLPTHFLSLMASKHVKVVLTGDGGDESFAGYDRYIVNNIAQVIHQTSGALELCKVVEEGFKWIGENKHSLTKLGTKYSLLLNKIGLQTRNRYPSWLSYFSEEQKLELCPTLLSMNSDDYLQKLVDKFVTLHPVDLGMAVDIASYLPEDLLVKLDVTTMASGLEARSPFLDHLVMEYVASLPVKLKIHHNQKKYLLKKAFAHILPERILNRKKMGFGIPIGKWFRGPLKNLLCEGLLDLKLPFFQQEVVERYVTNHLNEQSDNSFKLWNLLVLNLWLNSVKVTKPNDS